MSHKGTPLTFCRKHDIVSHEKKYFHSTYILHIVDMIGNIYGFAQYGHKCKTFPLFEGTFHSTYIVNLRNIEKFGGGCKGIHVEKKH